jgi:hypothetical protein
MGRLNNFGESATAIVADSPKFPIERLSDLLRHPLRMLLKQPPGDDDAAPAQCSQRAASVMVPLPLLRIQVIGGAVRLHRQLLLRVGKVQPRYEAVVVVADFVLSQRAG